MTSSFWLSAVIAPKGVIQVPRARASKAHQKNRQRPMLSAQMSLTAALLLAFSLPGRAAGLPALIRDAVTGDPAILEARANEEAAASRGQAARAQRYPTFGVQAGEYVANPGDYGKPFRGIVSRVNLYSAGAVDASIEREAERAQSSRFRTAEARESVAANVAALFLEALRAEELLQAERVNLTRHQRIVDDLQVIVENDKGRRYEWVQASSRALQVRMRIVQYEKAMKLALSKLTRYTQQVPTLSDPINDRWREAVSEPLARLPHPAVEAQRREALAVRADQKAMSRQRWPRVDLEAGMGNSGYARIVLNGSFFDRSADYTVQAAAQQIVAAEKRAELLEREFDQRSATAQADMAQSQLLIKAAEAQIGASASVVELYELQFKVGRRSLIELVNAYAELAAVEASRINAANDYRQAVIGYLFANARLADWAAAQP